MSIHRAHAYIELEITRMGRLLYRSPDRTFIEGMIEMAAHLQQIDPQEADAYRKVLAVKSRSRFNTPRRAA